MNVTVKLFALTRDLAEMDEVSLQMEPSATIAELRAAMADQLPVLKPVLASCAFAINNEYATDASRVSEEAEIACLPPVSGG